WRSNGYNFACIRRNHRSLVEIVEFTTGIGTDTLGAEIGFGHSRGSWGVGPFKSVLHLASCKAPVNSASALREAKKRRDDGARGCVVGRALIQGSRPVAPTELTPLMSRRTGPVQGRVRVPGDKSISHRALIVGALTVGETTIGGMLE